MGKASLYDKTDKNLQRISKTVGAVTILVCTITGIYSWVNEQFQSSVATRIESFREEMLTINRGTEQAITRLELMTLIANEPRNTVAIEKLARHYFQDLDGDMYVTQKYSDWARQYGGDITIIIGVK